MGVYFELVRQRVDADEWFFITHGHTRGERKRDDAPLPWADRLAAAHEAHANSGEVSTISLMVVGTPTRIAPKDGFVLLTIEQVEIPPLPKGSPHRRARRRLFLSAWRRLNGES